MRNSLYPKNGYPGGGWNPAQNPVSKRGWGTAENKVHGSDPASQPGNLIPVGIRTPVGWERERHLLHGGKKEEDFQCSSKTGKTEAGEALEEQTTSMAEHFPGHGEIPASNCSGCMESFPCL